MNAIRHVSEKNRAAAPEKYVERGEFEIALSPASDLVYAQEVVLSTANRHGIHAAMHPKASEDGFPIGLHSHLSLDREELSDSFLAGLLAHFRSITTVLMGGYVSYAIREFMYDRADIIWSRGMRSPIRRVE